MKSPNPSQMAGRREGWRTWARLGSARPGLKLLAFNFLPFSCFVFFFSTRVVEDAPLEPGALDSARSDNALHLYSFICDCVPCVVGSTSEKSDH